MRVRVRNKAGFTLVELLVVLAIMAILTGMLFPVFGRTREHARRSACVANMHSIATALKMYRLDNFRLDPPWLSSLAEEEYIGSNTVFICPSDAGKGLVWRWPGVTEADFAELDDYAFSGHTVPCSYMFEFSSAPCSWDPRIGETVHDWHYYDGTTADAAAVPPQVYPDDLRYRCPQTGTNDRAHSAYTQPAASPMVAYPAQFWSWRDVKMMQMHGKYCPVCRTTLHGETQLKKADGTIGFPKAGDYATYTGAAIFGYGEDVPIVRCGHHVRTNTPQYMNQGLNYVNLAYGGFVYLSNAQWELDRQVVGG